MKEKLSVLTSLIQMALADKEVREEEYRLMLGMAQLLKIDKSTFDQLFDENIEFIAPKNEFERITQFHRLLLVAFADEELNEAEVIELKRFGLKLGLRPEALDRVFQELPQYERGQIPAPVMLRIFQTYHN